ncbi:ribonuclease E inhibitor RraB [Gottfriedia acidiceleris]|uniref:ribonuclease E inhibitor RraB n=1 Tax=Gottfriedia acidiceleris TaxID=371036 RepID=UPI003AF9D091
MAKESFNFEEKYSNIDEDLDEEYDFTIRISRIDHVDLDSIDELTDFLIEASDQFGGNYDGWKLLLSKNKH